MAKQTTPAFNINAFVDASIQALAKTGDAGKAIKAAAPLIKGKTLAECIDAFNVGSGLIEGVSAAIQAAANEARAVLTKDGVDIENKKAVLDALRPIFWTKAGYAEPLKQDTTNPLKGKQASDYTTISKRISIMGQRIMGKVPARRAVEATPVPRACYSAMLALKNDGMTKAQMLAAVAKLFPKAAK
jgi:hypothetical protein